MTSQRKAQANRSNSLRSTGPRSAIGRAISAQNAKRHGLSVALPGDVRGPMVHEIARLIRDDGVDEHTARELASRIVDYERNLAHERAAFTPNPQSPGVSTQLLAEFADQAGLGAELDMLTEVFSKAGGDETDRETLALYKRVNKLIARTNHKKAQHDALTSVRYYRRATNQLIKSLKAI